MNKIFTVTIAIFLCMIMLVSCGGDQKGSSQITPQSIKPDPVKASMSIKADQMYLSFSARLNAAGNAATYSLDDAKITASGFSTFMTAPDSDVGKDSPLNSMTLLTNNLNAIEADQNATHLATFPVKRPLEPVAEIGITGYKPLRLVYSSDPTKPDTAIVKYIIYLSKGEITSPLNNASNANQAISDSKVAPNNRIVKITSANALPPGSVITPIPK